MPSHRNGDHHTPPNRCQNRTAPERDISRPRARLVIRSPARHGVAGIYREQVRAPGGSSVHGCLHGLGCFRDWLSGDPNSLLPNASTIPASIGDAAGAGAPGSAREAADLLRTLQPVERTLTLLLAAVMAFGLTGPRGRLTRTTGMVVALTMVAAALFWRFTGLSLADGAILVAVGGAVGFLGGLCVRR